MPSVPSTLDSSRLRRQNHFQSHVRTQLSGSYSYTDQDHIYYSFRHDILVTFHVCWAEVFVLVIRSPLS